MKKLSQEREEKQRNTVNYLVMEEVEENGLLRCTCTVPGLRCRHKPREILTVVEAQLMVLEAVLLVLEGSLDVEERLGRLGEVSDDVLGDLTLQVAGAGEDREVGFMGRGEVAELYVRFCHNGFRIIVVHSLVQVVVVLNLVLFLLLLLFALLAAALALAHVVHALPGLCTGGRLGGGGGTGDYLGLGGDQEGKKKGSRRRQRRDGQESHYEEGE